MFYCDLQIELDPVCLYGQVGHSLLLLLLYTLASRYDITA